MRLIVWLLPVPGKDGSVLCEHSPSSQTTVVESFTASCVLLDKLCNFSVFSASLRKWK